MHINYSAIDALSRLRSTQNFVLSFLRLVAKVTPQALLKFFELRDTDAAELTIIAVCQKDTFCEGITYLKRGQNIPQQSTIFKWSPHLNEFGILRIKIRIDFIEGVAVIVTRPVILPKNHPVTRLVIDFYHRKFHHHHHNETVNEVRQRFCEAALRVLV